MLPRLLQLARPDGSLQLPLAKVVHLLHRDVGRLTRGAEECGCLLLFEEGVVEQAELPAERVADVRLHEEHDAAGAVVRQPKHAPFARLGVDDGVVQLKLVPLADVAALDVADEQLGRPLLARLLVHVCPVDPVSLHRPVRKGLGNMLRPNLVCQLPLLRGVLGGTRPRRVAAGTTRAADGAPAVGVSAARRRRRRWRRADRLDDGAVVCIPLLEGCLQLSLGEELAASGLGRDEEERIQVLDLGHGEALLCAELVELLGEHRGGPLRHKGLVMELEVVVVGDLCVLVFLDDPLLRRLGLEGLEQLLPPLRVRHRLEQLRAAQEAHHEDVSLAARLKGPVGDLDVDLPDLGRPGAEEARLWRLVELGLVVLGEARLELLHVHRPQLAPPLGGRGGGARRRQRRGEGDDGRL
mmetsp:Transcript_19989/g.63801  ORF Transcript_19989/g.63801 Transcript_19989/m.63801 type:complete len:411 (+) Transcript_19989:1686-2918(+)